MRQSRASAPTSSNDCRVNVLVQMIRSACFQASVSRCAKGSDFLPARFLENDGAHARMPLAVVGEQAPLQFRMRVILEQDLARCVRVACSECLPCVGAIEEQI